MPESSPNLGASAAREFFRPVTRKAAELLIRYSPGTTAGEVTETGGKLVATGVELVREGHPILGGLVMTIGDALDGVDGIHAKLRREQGLPESPESVGNKKDFLWDRLGELFKGAGRIRAAQERGDGWDETAAVFSTIARTLPSNGRANAESNNKEVPEMGNGLLGPLGTRAGGAVTGSLGLVLPKVNGFPLQRTLDVITGALSLKTFWERELAAKNGKEADLKPEQIEQARERYKLSKWIVGGSIALAAVLVLTADRSKNKKS